jgi:hypothetical protein
MNLAPGICVGRYRIINALGAGVDHSAAVGRNDAR